MRPAVGLVFQLITHRFVLQSGRRMFAAGRRKLLMVAISASSTTTHPMSAACWGCSSNWKKTQSHNAASPPVGLTKPGFVQRTSARQRVALI